MSANSEFAGLSLGPTPSLVTWDYEAPGGKGPEAEPATRAVQISLD